LHHQATKAQINLGLYPPLDEKRGSGQLATIRSPVEFLSVNAEFTSKRIDMFRKHSKEMAELSTKR
jgi:hypothetical protein